MTTSRRNFLIGSAVALGTAAVGLGYRFRSQLQGTLLSAFEDARGDQYVGGVTLESGEVFGARIPMRAHGCAIDPRDPQRVLFFARRPGTAAFELRRDTMQVRQLFETPAGRHLAGHGVFSRDGALVYTPEHDYENARGVVAVRRSSDFSIVAEIDTQGIDPHEVAWLPDGSLLVANGGIMTHPRTFRRKLNIATMDPSLCVIDADSGACREQLRLPDHLLSIRHLAMTANGTTAIGLQYEGEPADAPGIVAVYRPGAGLRLLPSPQEQRAHFRGYVASISISEPQQLIAAACPYGNGVACWSTANDEFLGFIAAAENYGLSRLADGTIVASQRDGTAYEIDKTPLRSHFLQLDSEFPLRWDDHWVAAT
ncbi:MAG TPA: DUF1513 domain-containing protein [Povalibacter sp.]|uniref:DUF1513 domain-containing protein n=1 Tax=Povalibacter sp. TaxID=1962978 RepID=UPI002CAAD251|nr:DUF1513 domain-containing protein [Povalibacter sp.]HMN45611.1 DUF1513 domain-containing protein [Povalibacter sp.]